EQFQIALNLFEREASVLEELGHHPQIPDFYAFFPLMVPNGQGQKDEPFFYLVQEYIDGQDLEREQAVRGRAYTEPEVREILEAILKVLEFVHARKVIHRDIKPSNIMRDRAGQLYLLDFGAVKQIAAGAGAPQGRSTGIYSMGYAPPEQMQGGQIYFSTDLYALAATCLILLTHKSSEDLFDAYNNRWDWQAHASHTSETLVAVLERMLQPTPRDRFGSATEVLEALQQVQAPVSPPPLPTQPPVSYPPTLPPSAPPPVPAASPAPPSPQPSPPPSPPPVRPTPSSSRLSQFSLVETIGNAGFTGFEGALLAIALSSGLGLSPISVGLLGAGLGGLIYAQYRRTIEGIDLLIIAAITLGLVGFIPFLHGASLIQNLGLPAILAVGFVGLFVGAGAIAATVLFRLIYQLLSLIL
ncbi:MAG: serine/threonine-protein kinase, partial [Cyanobacteriota bacterium]|nr:serine/threonine-protein kinase [Cyanobacteriota bacterium]